jgi:hypothetical protein
VKNSTNRQRHLLPGIVAFFFWRSPEDTAIRGSLFRRVELVIAG